MSQNTNITIIQLRGRRAGGPSVRAWRRWGWGATPSALECCCWRWVRRAALLAAPSALWPVKSASAETCPPREPASRPPRLLVPNCRLPAENEVLIPGSRNSRRCSRSSAERTETPRRTACSSGSTDPGSAALCSPRRAPVVPERKENFSERSIYLFIFIFYLSASQPNGGVAFRVHCVNYSLMSNMPSINTF